MFKKKLTFMFVPSSTGVSRQISIPVAVFYLSISALAILLVGSFFLSSQYFSDRVSEKELDQLRSENKSLADKYEQIRWNLAETESRFEELAEKEVRIRTLFGLPEIDEGARQLGVGGPIPSGLAAMSDLERVAYSSEVEVDRLLRLSRFELSNFEDVEASLLKISKRLDHTPSIWPTKGWRSRGYGMKHDPFTGYKQMHRGIDVASRTGTPIIASADGVIEKITRTTGLGKLIVINHGYGYKTRYGHLSKFKVKRGQRVKRGDLIGLMGSTGYSTGPHLHYEVIRKGKFVDPYKYILNQM